MLSGEEEAELGFSGAGPISSISKGVLVDKGGGSTEVVEFNENDVIAASSLPVGSLNLYNRHVKKLLPSDNELKK